MEQNLDASRILILESALDPVQPGPEPEERARRSRDNAWVLTIMAWGIGRRLICINLPDPGVHSKTRSENFQGLHDTC